MAATKDFSGMRFGRLVAVAPTEERKNKKIMWECLCDCGAKVFVRSGDLPGGKVKSCGCSRKDMISHGQTSSTEYRTWTDILQRCNNPNSKAFKDYGGRGVYVCQRWASFENFYSDMGKRPSKYHSIDRIDNNGPYSAENCRWATQSEQNRNKRTNRIVKVRGGTLCLADAVDRYGKDYKLVMSRLRKGWSVERAIFEKNHGKKRSASNG